MCILGRICTLRCVRRETSRTYILFAVARRVGVKGDAQNLFTNRLLRVRIYFFMRCGPQREVNACRFLDLLIFIGDMFVQRK